VVKISVFFFFGFSSVVLFFFKTTRRSFYEKCLCDKIFRLYMRVCEALITTQFPG
jgi:hypothetical protein